MSGYTITQIGPMDSWRDYVGGFRPDTTRPGRRVVDHEMSGRFVGLTANSYVPGEQCGYWHVHSVLEEVYVFLDGEGQMGLDDEIIDVAGGNSITVTDPRGRRVNIEPTEVLGNQLIVKLRPSRLLGRYTVSYRVVSEDGHPISSRYTFWLSKKPTR